MHVRSMSKPPFLCFLRQYGAEHVLDGPYLYDRYDISKTKEYLSMLTPESMFVYLTSKDFTTVVDKTERWYVLLKFLSTRFR